MRRAARSLRLGQKFEPCPYCGRKFYATDRSRAENPHCRRCLHDRVREATAGLSPPRLVHRDDGYVEFVRA